MMKKMHSLPYFLLLVGLLATAFAAFSPLLRAPFLFDDWTVIVHDPAMAASGREHSGAKVPDGAEEKKMDKAPIDAPSATGGQPSVLLFRDLWRMPRPLRQFTHRLDARLFGTGPMPGHAVNIALHALAAFLGAVLLVSLGLPLRRAAFGAFVFLLLPVTLESVGIVSHRKEMLSTLFLFAGLAAAQRRRLVPVAALFFVLACLGKETALVFPGLLLACAMAGPVARREHGYHVRFHGIVLWSAFAVALAFLLHAQARAAMAFQHANPSLEIYRAGHFGPGATWSLAFSAALRAFPHYVHTIADPFASHTIDPPFSLGIPLCSAWTALGALTVALAIAALWAVRRTRFFPPLLWMGIALAPYLFPPLLRNGGIAAFADRYAYLASFGFSWLLVASPPVRIPVSERKTAMAWVRHMALPMVSIAFLVILGARTYHLARYYETNVSFWRHAARKNPDSAPAHCNLAYAIWTETHDRDAAIAEYDKMFALAPDFLFGILSHVGFLIESGDPVAADQALSNALDSGLPTQDRVRILQRRAELRLDECRWPEALADFEAARNLGANNPAFHRGYAESLKRTLHWPEAVREIRLAAARNPAFRKEADAFRVLVEDPPMRDSRSVLLVGDSVPHGTHSGEGDGASDRPLSAYLAEQRPDLTFLDETLEGSTAAGLGRGFPRVVRRHQNAACCLIMTGHNDAFFGTPAEEILFHLSGVFASARRSGMRPLVLGPIPVRSTSKKDRTRQEEILDELDRRLADFCADANVPFASFRKALDESGAEVQTVLVSTDGNHLSDSGMDILADIASKFLPPP